MRAVTYIMALLVGCLSAQAAVSNKLIRITNAHVNRALDELHTITWAQAEGVTLEYQWNTNSFPVDLSATNVLLVFEVAAVTNANTLYISATGAVVSSTNREVRWVVSPSNANLRPVLYNGYVRALDVVGGTQQNMRVLARQAVTVAASPDASLYNIVGPLGGAGGVASNFTLISVGGTNLPGTITLAAGTGAALRVSDGSLLFDVTGSGSSTSVTPANLLANGGAGTSTNTFYLGSWGAAVSSKADRALSTVAGGVVSGAVQLAVENEGAETSLPLVFQEQPGQSQSLYSVAGRLRSTGIDGTFDLARLSDITASAISAVTNGGVTINGQPVVNGAAITTESGQIPWTNTQNAGGQALTNASGLTVTGGLVKLTGADVRVSPPAYGDSPATKDYVDAGASAYVTNAVNRLVYPDATTNAGVTILGFTDPNFTNVVLTPDGKATLQMKPIPRIEWCFDLTSTSSVMDTTWDAPPVTTNVLAAATGGVWSLYLGRTNHSYSVTNGSIILSTVGVSTGYAFSALGQALPPPPWRFEVELGHGTYSNRQICGLAIAETNGGRAYVVSRYRRNGQAGLSYVELAHLSSFTAMGNEFLIIALPAPDSRYYALENDGTNFSAWYSADGLTWSFFAQSLTNNPWSAGANFRPQQIAIMWDWAQNGQTSLVQRFDGSSRWFRRTR